jgi:hypothetical protein
MTEAVPGAFVLFERHIAYIEEVRGDKMIISETNFKPCQFSIREIDLGDPSIRGYFRP